MQKGCIIEGCSSKLGFPFPIERPQTNTKWITAIKEHQAVIPDFINYIVCKDHFVPSDFLNNDKDASHLLETAVPSVFPAKGLPVEDNYNFEADQDDVKEEPVDIEDLPYDFDRNADVESSIESESEISIKSEDIESYEIIENEDSDDSFDNSQCFGRLMENRPGTTTVIDIGTEEEVDSDHDDSDTEFDVQKLKEKLATKEESLKENETKLHTMLDMIGSQAKMIQELQETFELLGRNTKDELEKNIDICNADDETHLPCKISNDDKDLQVFAISLYYFSPKVYTYLCSIIPYLPSKAVIADWVRSGQALTFFPPGVLDVSKLSFE